VTRTRALHLITRWENFTTATGMPDAKVFCVTVDGERVWAGTEDGLVLIENGKVVKVYRPADALAHRAVMGIAVNKNTGDLWIATFHGFSHFSAGRFENFTNLDYTTNNGSATGPQNKKASEKLR
jgi:ligand-binding sensor domain-containing protein